MWIKLVVLGIVTLILLKELLGPIEVKIFVWLIKTAVIKSSRQTHLDVSIILLYLSSIISVIALYIFSNLIASIILAVTILFYVFVYTIWLKRKTPQNIVIGGASGALPPVIGSTIATNTLTLETITFFLIIFYWTPSHFWALSLYKAKDY